MCSKRSARIFSVGFWGTSSVFLIGDAMALTFLGLVKESMCAVGGWSNMSSFFLELKGDGLRGCFVVAWDMCGRVVPNMERRFLTVGRRVLPSLWRRCSPHVPGHEMLLGQTGTLWVSTVPKAGPSVESVAIFPTPWLSLEQTTPSPH